MQKTTLGISVGILGAITFFVSYYAGLLATIIIAGYVLLKEDNEWLKQAVIKALMITLTFSVATSVINLIPNTIGVVSQVLGLININFSIPFISELVNVITSVLSYVEKLLFLVLGLKALNQGTIKVPVVDDIINKYCK